MYNNLFFGPFLEEMVTNGTDLVHNLFENVMHAKNAHILSC